MTIAILFVTGLVAGIINALASGGGLVSFPVLLMLGLSPIVATATSFVATILGHVSSAYGYRGLLLKLRPVYLLLLIPAVLGSALGANLLKHSPSAMFNKIVPFLVLSSILIFILQPYLKKRIHLNIKAKHTKKIKPLIILTIAVFVVTIYGGYFGIGTGYAILALLSFTGVKGFHTLNGMKNIGSLVVLGIAIFFLTSADIIDWKSGIILAIGSLIGGHLGATVAQKIPGKVIRFLTILIGLSTVVYLFIKYYS
ncbi:sulfite exporter TauE/SafE family protein [Candidatus Saccharibacteria bacterium]|nr:sulfite exporter TauE/SafE family protein [Candidatus Saccharibacteria bacterium]